MPQVIESPRGNIMAMLAKVCTDYLTSERVQLLEKPLYSPNLVPAILHYFLI